MATKRKKSKSKARAGAPQCDCPSTAARKAFKSAKTCEAKSRALDVIKRLASEDEKTLKPGRRALLFRDLLKKEQQVQSTCNIESRRGKSARQLEEEGYDPSGLLGFRRRRRARRRR